MKQREPYMVAESDLAYYLQHRHLHACGSCFQDYDIETHIVCPKCEQEFYTRMYTPTTKPKKFKSPNGEYFRDWVKAQPKEVQEAIYTNTYYYPKRDPSYETYDVQSIKDIDEQSAFNMAMGNSRKKTAQQVKQDIKQQDKMNKMDIAADKQEEQ